MEVSAKAVESITALSSEEQTAINTATFNGATLLAMVQIDITPLAGGGTLFTTGLRTKQAAQASQIAQFKVKHRGPRFCTLGLIKLNEIINADIFEPPNTTVTIGDISTDSRGRFQDISGESAGVRWLQHFIFAYECPRLRPTASPTATPTPSPTPSPTPRPSASSGVSGASSTTGGSPSGGVAPAGT